MAIPIRANMIRDLISRRFGSVDGLIVEWEIRLGDGRLRIGKARNRGTVYRWLDEGLPHRKDDVLGLAGLLDLDPIALLRLDEDFFRKSYGQERRLFQLGAMGRSRLAAFWSLYIPGAGWPDNGLARKVYGREWVVKDVAHDTAAVSNVFAQFSFAPSVPAQPWVVHFAYRRAGARDGMWRPYGTVVRHSEDATLIAENGELLVERMASEGGTIRVETHFGPGAAEFRLASLHPFAMTVTAPSPGACRLRFSA